MAEKIIRNAAQCKHCGETIESKHRHDFVVHFCTVKKVKAKEWIGEGANMHLVETDSYTWLFALDGGKSYLRRIGSFEDMIDVSVYSESDPS